MRLSKPLLFAVLYILSPFTALAQSVGSNQISNVHKPVANIECEYPVTSLRPDPYQAIFWAKIRLDPQAYNMDWPELRRGSFMLSFHEEKYKNELCHSICNFMCDTDVQSNFHGVIGPPQVDASLEIFPGTSYCKNWEYGPFWFDNMWIRYKDQFYNVPEDCNIEGGWDWRNARQWRTADCWIALNIGTHCDGQFTGDKTCLGQA